MPGLIEYELRNVLIVDDHPLIRYAVSNTLSQYFTECQQDVRIHEAGDGESSIRQAGELSGCLALADLCMPKHGFDQEVAFGKSGNAYSRIIRAG